MFLFHFSLEPPPPPLRNLSKCLAVCYQSSREDVFFPSKLPLAWIRSLVGLRINQQRRANPSGSRTDKSLTSVYSFSSQAILVFGPCSPSGKPTEPCLHIQKLLWKENYVFLVQILFIRKFYFHCTTNRIVHSIKSNAIFVFVKKFEIEIFTCQTFLEFIKKLY